MVNTRQAQGEKSTTSDEDYTEKLLNKVCAKFVNQIEEKIDTRMERLEQKLSQVCNTLADLNVTVTENKRNVLKLQEQVDLLEQERKRKCIRLCGIAERSNENLGEVVSNFITEQLKIPCEKQDIDYVFRIGRRVEEASGNKTRTIIVKFVFRHKRNKVLMARKLLKGTPYTLFEDLTLKRYELLSAAQKKYGRNNVWSSDGNVFFWNAKENKKVKITKSE